MIIEHIKCFFGFHIWSEWKFTFPTLKWKWCWSCNKVKWEFDTKQYLRKRSGK